MYLRSLRGLIRKGRLTVLPFLALVQHVDDKKSMVFGLYIVMLHDLPLEGVSTLWILGLDYVTLGVFALISHFPIKMAGQYIFNMQQIRASAPIGHEAKFNTSGRIDMAAWRIKGQRTS